MAFLYQLKSESLITNGIIAHGGVTKMLDRMIYKTTLACSFLLVSLFGSAIYGLILKSMRQAVLIKKVSSKKLNCACYGKW